MSRKTAFITGASRGIGKATALAFAEKGYDVVITARTLLKKEKGAGEVPGSLEETAEGVEAFGRKVLPIRMDLLEQDSVLAAADEALSKWGHMDVLINNAVYQGKGVDDRILELEMADLQKIFQGNLFSQVALIKKILPHMLERSRGKIINMVSASGMYDPMAPAGEGGWGFGYSSSKAALIRMAGVLKAEHKESGVSFFNVEPGVVITEYLKHSGREKEFLAEFGYAGAPPKVPAAVNAWLVTSPEADEWNGKTIFAQKFCAKMNLVPEWNPQKIVIDGG